MRKLTNEIQCSDLAMALENGLAAIDVELGSASDLVIGPGSAPHPLTTRSSDEHSLEFLLALDARTDFVKAQISGDDDEMQRALDQAEWCGYSGYEVGSTAPPILLKSIPALSKAWQTGRNEAALVEEIDQCRGCEVARGDPCPAHD